MDSPSGVFRLPPCTPSDSSLYAKRFVPNGAHEKIYAVHGVRLTDKVRTAILIALLAEDFVFETQSVVSQRSSEKRL